MIFIKNIHFYILLFVLNSFVIFGEIPPIHKKLDLVLNSQKQIKGTLGYYQRTKDYSVIFATEEVEEVEVTSYNVKREIKSVFLYDINGDGTQEIFIISMENGKNYLEGFSLNLNNGRGELEFIKTFDVKTSKEINGKISQIKGFNASMAKSELKKYYPYYKLIWNDINYWNVRKRVGETEYNSKEFYFQYELREQDYKDFILKRKLRDFKLNIESTEFLGFVDNDGYFLEGNSVGRYIRKIGDYYLVFYLDINGIESQLLEIFQGKIENNRIIKHGKAYSESENGVYDNNNKVGEWKSFQWSPNYRRYLPVSLYYKNGTLEREDGYYRYKDTLYKIWSRYYNNQNALIKKVYYEENGEISQIRYYEDNILRSAINLAYFKREYSIYDKKIAANGYEYYENRKGLSKFKSLNLENMKLENDELNLYSIKDENEEKVFIRFEKHKQNNLQNNTLQSMRAAQEALGVKEIFYGHVKSNKIEKLEDIVRDGYFEMFSLGTFIDDEEDFTINKNSRIGEHVVTSGYFKMGKKNGIWKTFNPYRGDIEKQITYENDVLQGPYEIYDVDEALIEKGKYINGEKKTEWKAPPFFQFSM